MKFIKQQKHSKTFKLQFIFTHVCILLNVIFFPTASLREVEKAADHINGLVQEQENMQRMLKLQSCLCSGRPRIVTPGRRLLKEGLLLKVSHLQGFIHN
jgi:hypothetical protein